MSARRIIWRADHSPMCGILWVQVGRKREGTTMIYPAKPFRVRTADGDVITIAQVDPRTLTRGGEIVKLANVNHVHADARPECGPWSVRGSWETLTVDSWGPFADTLTTVHLVGRDSILTNKVYVRA